MKEVPSSAIRGWQGTGNLWFPTAISLICPECGERVVFSAVNPKPDREWGMVTSLAVCPVCSKKIFLWAIGCKGTLDEIKAGKGTLAIHPHAGDVREPIEGSENAPERIQRAYRDALDSYNQRLWSPAVVSCRRTLKGIVIHQLPEGQRKGTLNQQLEKLPKHVNLEKPLIDLTHAVRQSGNLGAHFDLERDTDREVAKAAVEFIEFFLEYLYVLPTQVEELRTQLSEID